MKTNRIVVLKNQIGFGIYDTVEESFIGLLQKRGAGKVSDNKARSNVWWNWFKY